MASLLRHYFQLAARGLVNHKLYSIINILGLSVALTCTVFVVLFVRYELSYDGWLPETRNLYRVEVSLRMPGAPARHIGAAPYPLGTAMRRQIPGVTGVTRLIHASTTLAHGDRQFLEKNVNFVNGNFFKLIHLPFIEGNPRSALSQPESVVLSESAARQYFGNRNPMGRTLTANVRRCAGHDTACHDRTVSLRVTGVVRDLPRNTQLTGNAFIPLTSLSNPTPPGSRTYWFSLNFITYVSLAPRVKPAAILAKMPPILDRDVTGILGKSGTPLRGSQLYTVHLTRFTQVHLDSAHWIGNLTPPGSWSTLYGAVIIAILILLLACFNFTNLATARAALRACEIGLRKTLGATRRQLALQFLSEAVFLALISLLCAAAAAEILLPAFNGFLHQSNTLDYAKDWRLDSILFGVAMAVGLVSGIYPALVLSRLRPVAALQAKAGHSETRIGLRDLLVLMQFAVSIGLGIAALVVFRQVDYARSMNMGFRRDHILVIGNRHLSGKQQEALAQALRANPGVREVALSAYVPLGSGFSDANIQVPGNPSQVTVNYMFIGPDYPGTYGIALVAGRGLSALRGKDRFSSRGKHRVRDGLVNVVAARRLGFTAQQAVGQTVVFGRSRVLIVGVLADAKTQGAREPVSPTLYLYNLKRPMNFSVRLRPGNIPQTVAFIDRTWHAFVPTVAIQRWFLNARFARLYRSDERDGTVFGVFVMIAIFIACLGLYGLVVFTAERRTKEVAVRKICGARMPDILRIMLWRISVPVLLGNVIAWPVAYYYLHRWLEGFADHIWLDPAYFIAGGAVALAIAWATVFAHTLRLAHTSPVHALRYE